MERQERGHNERWVCRDDDIGFCPVHLQERLHLLRADVLFFAVNTQTALAVHAQKKGRCALRLNLKQKKFFAFSPETEVHLWLHSTTPTMKTAAGRRKPPGPPKGSLLPLFWRPPRQ